MVRCKKIRDTGFVTFTILFKDNWGDERQISDLRDGKASIFLQAQNFLSLTKHANNQECENSEI